MHVVDLADTYLEAAQWQGWRWLSFVGLSCDTAASSGCYHLGLGP